MSAITPIVVTVYMGQRDITKWCRSVTWSQPDQYLEQTWSVTTHAWHLFDPAARYDIYASYDPDNPRDTCVIRQGYVVQDQRQRVNVTRGEQPLVTVDGKSYSSISFRRCPQETIVMLPCPDGDARYSLAQRVLKQYDGPVGRLRVWSNCWDLHRDVVYLAHAASFSAIYHGPNIPMQPVVVPPQLTYWEAILQLIEPFALEVYYTEWFNTLWFIDPVSRRYGLQSISIPGSLIEQIDAVPVLRRRPRRVIVRVPAWP